MKKKVWDLYAPIYEKAMRMDQKYYQYMYDRMEKDAYQKQRKVQSLDVRKTVQGKRREGMQK